MSSGFPAVPAFFPDFLRRTLSREMEKLHLPRSAPSLFFSGNFRGLSRRLKRGISCPVGASGCVLSSFPGISQDRSSPPGFFTGCGECRESAGGRKRVLCRSGQKKSPDNNEKNVVEWRRAGDGSAGGWRKAFSYWILRSCPSFSSSSFRRKASRFSSLKKLRMKRSRSVAMRLPVSVSIFL